MSIDELARTFGFADAAEFHRLVAEADIGTPEKLSAFKAWQENDGTKDGLLALGVMAAETQQGGNDGR